MHPMTEAAGGERVALVGLFALTAAVFLTSLPAFLEVWSAQPYTHGYLIAVATVWLVWRERDVFRRARVLWPPALAVAAVASSAWLVSTIAHIQVVVLAAVPIVLLAWAAAVFGRDAARRLTPVAAIFLLAVPLWGVFTEPLRRVTTIVSAGAAGLLGVPAEIEGNVVHIASGSFLIEGGCAGLNYLMSGLTIGALYAQSFLVRWRYRAAVVALAATIAIVGNWVRVTAMIMIGHATDMHSAFLSGRPHLVFGWGVFVIGLLVFFPVARLVEKRDARQANDRGAVGSTNTEASEESAGLRAPVLATVAALLGPAIFAVVGALPTRRVPPFDPIAHESAWQTVDGGTTRSYSWTPSFVGWQERVQQGWSKDQHTVWMDRLIYRHQAQGAELIGFVSRIAPDEALAADRMFGPVGKERRLVNEAIVRSGDSYVLVWYWYRVGGVDTADAIRAKLLEIWAFLSRTQVSELVAFSAPCSPDSCAGAFETLTDFFGAT